MQNQNQTHVTAQLFGRIFNTKTSGLKAWFVVAALTVLGATIFTRQVQSDFIDKE